MMILRHFRPFSRRYFSSINQSYAGYEQLSAKEAEQYGMLLQQYQLQLLDSQQVFVVQPWYHHLHPMAKTHTSKDLMMAESLGLVQTLGWKTVHELVLNIHHDKPEFGIGQLENLKDKIDEIESKKGVYVSSVFYSSYQISSKNRILAESILEKPMLDRYSVILQVFRKHAATKEAKLQVQLAEIPYLKSRLVMDLQVENESKHSKHRKGQEYFDKQRLALNRREKKIKADLEKVKAQRTILRSNRQRGKLPSVAVIGYTNAGKTSLIKALTGTEKLEPQDKLFATLDVTAHSMTLPSQLESFMIDTVGFISDIPISLIASFNATLEDASLADLLLHVRDVSHPDHFAQNQTVLNTMAGLNMPRKLLKNMITVGNKCDKIHQQEWQSIRDDGMIPISTKSGQNMEELLERMDNLLLQSTNRIQVKLRVPTGSHEYARILKETFVSQTEICQKDENFSIITALILNYEVKKYQNLMLENE